MQLQPFWPLSRECCCVANDWIKDQKWEKDTPSPSATPIFCRIASPPPWWAKREESHHQLPPHHIMQNQNIDVRLHSEKPFVAKSFDASMMSFSDLSGFTKTGATVLTFYVNFRTIAFIEQNNNKKRHSATDWLSDIKYIFKDIVLKLTGNLLGPGGDQCGISGTSWDES